MAAVAPPSDQAADLLKNLSLDAQSQTTEPVKKPSVDAEDGQGQLINRSLTPLIPDFMDPAVAYYPNAYASTAYYYGGYDGTMNDWDDYSRYMSPDGVDMYGYGYAPYGPYSPAGSPVPTAGNDGQFYGAQHYQYLSPYFQSMAPTGGPYPSAAASPKGEINTSAGTDQAPLSVDTANGNSNCKVNGVGAKENTGSEPVKPTTYQNSALNGNGLDGVYYPMSWLDVSLYSDWQPRNNANTASLSKGNSVASRNNLMSSRLMSSLNTASGYMNRMYPNKLYGGYGNGYQSGYGFGSNAYYSQNNSGGWLDVDNKYKPRGRGNCFYGCSNENVDGLNELNRGPRAKITKNQKVLTPIIVDQKGQNITSTTTACIEKASLTPNREQYNLMEFPVTYDNAKFFIIKSYSEDDVHKSIKYNVWASTQNGNKKLDAAFQEAQQKPGRCPVFLFFSVNTSGQFVGVAEMVGPVDFDKNLEYWQQDKWIGCFPVKWHIVKDVPNSLLKHVTLEYNENKPVTNSRDTQEVKLDQGLQVITIFKEHSSKQCILDDFEFYEDRQKRIQEKKAKQKQFQKQVWAIDEMSKEDIKVEVIPPKSVEVLPDLVNEANPKVMENVQKDPAAKVGDVAKPAEKTVLLNGLANGC